MPYVPGGAAASIKAGRALTKTALINARRRGVNRAWKEERQLLEQTGKGSRDWNKAEKAQLLKDGKVTGYEGHHINSVKDHPGLADNPDNIKFVPGREAHKQEHGGKFQNKTTGKLINRKKMLEEHMQKQQGGYE